MLPGYPTPTTAPRWSLGWPRAHDVAITNAASEAKIPATLLMALAREESTFDADVVSWAGAVGLCQLMPPTAKEEAQKLGLTEPTVDLLKDPVLNARLGAQHLAGRIQMLRHPLLAIAAYNAGPGAVLKWKPAKGAPLDAFVEEIPVDETRNYVKKVTGSWATYEALDGSLSNVSFTAIIP